MRFSLRLIVSLLLASAIVALGFTIWQIQHERQRMLDDLHRRGLVLAESLKENLLAFDWQANPARLKELAQRFNKRERLLGIAMFDNKGIVLAASHGIAEIASSLPAGMDELADASSLSKVEPLGGRNDIRCLVTAIHRDSGTVGYLGLYYEVDFIFRYLRSISRYNFMRFLVTGLLISVITLLLVRWNIIAPIESLTHWLRSLRAGHSPDQHCSQVDSSLKPLMKELSHLTKSLAEARAKAAEEARLRIEGEALWTAERLGEYLRRELKEKTLFIVSNREPYMHRREGKTVKCIIPAGGLVTALDPVLRACGGTWIAHGSGDADRETADKEGKLGVPPEEPKYILRRMWLTKEEEQGYYYGLANEGLWPLCHITHTRPIFRLEDWNEYQRVNQKFAEMVLEEIADEKSPLVLIQDYHFALLPLLIKARRADARVAIFWHIPWPNPEVFEICPWKKEILLGMLGGDLVGFHTQFHCNNFLDTVDRVLESKINWEDFSVERRGQLTGVRPFPISVAGDEPEFEKSSDAFPRAALLQEYGIRAKLLGVGVDRLDYTKGIPERLLAVERVFEKHPEYVGAFTYVELGPPSRIHIPRYQALLAELDSLIERINWRFATRDWKPVVMIKSHHSHDVLRRFYRAADICLVTSLHDGMNLVAKEFVSARNDQKGVLILSRFTGAARELHDALIVNPYDIESLADLIHRALTMPVQEQNERMRQMRQTVRERNVYRWAANLITTLSRWRIPKQVQAASPEKENA